MKTRILPSYSWKGTRRLDNGSNPKKTLGVFCEGQGSGSLSEERLDQKTQLISAELLVR